MSRRRLLASHAPQRSAAGSKTRPPRIVSFTLCDDTWVAPWHGLMNRCEPGLNGTIRRHDIHLRQCVSLPCVCQSPLSQSVGLTQQSARQRRTLQTFQRIPGRVQTPRCWPVIVTFEKTACVRSYQTNAGGTSTYHYNSDHIFHVNLDRPPDLPRCGNKRREGLRLLFFKPALVLLRRSHPIKARSGQKPRAAAVAS